MTTEISIEFFPPQTPEGVDKLRSVRAKLAELKPSFFSVTFGAGGTTQERTFETVFEIQNEGHQAAPHLSCIGSTRPHIRDILQRYKDAGIRRIVALRGDLPSGVGDPGELRYANELVEFIRRESGDWFRIEVGCYPETHPQANDAFSDLANLRRKFEAGADGAITQYFFNADAYFRFVADARRIGITQPIVPGIMPIGNFSQLKRFSEMCGAEIPRWIGKRMLAYGDDAESVRAFGIEVLANLCRQLIAGGAESLHFYTLNRAKTTLAVLDAIG